MKTATLFALVTLLPVVAAQQPEARGGPFVLDAGDIKLAELVDRCAAYLQWNILSSPQELASCPSQEVHTQVRISVDRDGCQELLTSMLTRSAFVLTVLDEPKRNREIVSRAVRRTPDEVLARPTLRVPVTTVLELKHTNATIAVNALRPFFASAGGQSMLTVGNLGNSTSVLLSGLQDQVATAIGMVRAGDVPAPAGTAMDAADRLSVIERRLAAIEKKIGMTEKGEER
jgi:hypothetical protein